MNTQEKTFSLVGHRPYESRNRFRSDIIAPMPKVGPIVDAIGVPQGRPAPSIERPARLAHDANTALLSVCSHEAKIGEVASFLYGMKQKAPPTWYAIEMPPGYEIPGVDLRAQEEIPPQARKNPFFDLPPKRDVLSLLERMIGNESLLYHDDDLFIPLMALLAVARTARGRRRAGLRNSGGLDRSVNQHGKNRVLTHHFPGLWLYSDKGIRSAQPSENSSVINPQEVNEHSPRLIYNEDTIREHSDMEDGMAGLTLEASYVQDEYNPFADPGRAAKEEFGDIFADGLYNEKRDADALYSAEYWQKEIEDRRRELEWSLKNLEVSRNREYLRYTHFLSGGKIKYSLDPMPEDEQREIGEALRAGLAINETLTGQNFVNYQCVREEDRKRYGKMLKGLPKFKTREEGLSYLALTSYITNVE